MPVSDHGLPLQLAEREPASPACGDRNGEEPYTLHWSRTAVIGEGAAEWLDQPLVRRELACIFGGQRPGLATSTALPQAHAPHMPGAPHIIDDVESDIAPMMLDALRGSVTRRPRTDSAPWSGIASAGRVLTPAQVAR